MDAPQDGSKKREGLHQRGTICGVNQELSWCQWSLTLLPLELKEKLSGLQLEIELTNKVLDVQDESGCRPWFQIREQGGEGD